MGSEGEVQVLLSPLTVNTTKQRTDEVRGELIAVADEPVSPTARLLHEPRFNFYVIAVIGFGKRIDVGVMKAGLKATLVHHSRFSSILVWGEDGCKSPKWVRTEVDLDHHLVVPELDPVAATASPDQLLEDYIASLSTAATLDLSRPLWEFHLLNLRTADAEGVGIFRIHHSLGDGVSLISLLLACTRQSSHPDSLPTLPAPHRLPPPRCLLRRVRDTMALVWNTLVDVLFFIATLLFLSDTETPLKAPKASHFRRCPMRLVHRTLSLEDVKSVKNALHCTINDVLVGVTSAGISRYLSRSYKDGLLESIRLRQALIFNIRPTPGIPALAKMMEGSSGSGSARWGNAVGYAILPLWIGMCQDPLDYVRKAKEIVDRKKNSFEALISHITVAMSTRIFSSKAAAALCRRMFDQTTLTFSNVVGPVEEIEFYGHPLVYLVPSVFGCPHATTLHFQSYMNKMRIVLTVDEMVVPNPGQLLEDFDESLKLIKNAALVRS